MHLVRKSIIPRSAVMSALISAAACAPRTYEPPGILPVTDVCDTIVTDSTGPAPRVPEAGSIAPGRGAMIGVAVDARRGYALGRTVVHFTGRSENWALTDSVGRFVMNELPPGLYLLDAVRIGYRHSYFTATVRRGQATAVALPLRKQVCGIVQPSPGSPGSRPGDRPVGIDPRAGLEDAMRERAK